MIERFNLSRRHVVGGIGAAAGLAWAGQGCAAAAMPDSDYVQRFVHPDLRPMVTAILASQQGEAPLAARLPALRRMLAGSGKLPSSTTRLEVVSIAGLVGQPPVTAIVMNAKPGQSRPGILYTHGGGFVAGAAMAAVEGLLPLCEALDCVIVVPDYRLAPEFTYHASMADTYAALVWLHSMSERLGCDPGRLAVMGDSAGGGHAALLARVARDRGEVSLAFQCLTYPMLDDRTGSTRAVPDHMGRIIWNAADNHFGWRSFLGMEPGTGKVPIGAVPSRETRLAGLPPAFIGVGSLDLFHDEDVEYARRLNDAGVPAELIVVPGAFHTFDLMPTPVSGWFRDARLLALRRALSVSGRADTRA